MVWDEDRWREYRFDVTAVSRLTVRLLAWPSDKASEDERRGGAVLLGSVCVDPFVEARGKGRTAWVDLDEGAGRLLLATKFQELAFVLPAVDDDDGYDGEQ